MTRYRQTLDALQRGEALDQLAADLESRSVTPATTDSDGPVVVGSGFASDTLDCPACSRSVERGWEAWVTAWDDPDRRAFHPDCYRPTR